LSVEIGILIIVVSVDVVPHPHHLAHRRIWAMIAPAPAALAHTEEADEQGEDKKQADD